MIDPDEGMGWHERFLEGGWKSGARAEALVCLCHDWNCMNMIKQWRPSNDTTAEH